MVLDRGLVEIEFDGGARVASNAGGGNIELYLDSLAGPQIGTCVVSNIGGWQTWITESCPISGASGVHDLYLRFTGSDFYLLNVNWWQFLPYGDMDEDSIVNISDFPDFIDYWLQDDRSLDLDGDCVITLYGFSRFAANWMIME